MAVETKDVLLRSVPAQAAKALKRAAVELDQPMGQVFSGLVREFLGMYVALHRAPEELAPEERRLLSRARADMARGRYAPWDDVKRALRLG